MNLRECLKLNYGLVFDGIEDDFYDYKLELFLNGIKEVISEKPYKFSYINNLLKSISESEYSRVISSIQKSTPSLNIEKMYLGADNLPITYTIYNSNSGRVYLIIISSGEFQPGRYKIYLEGVWEVEGLN